MLHAIDSREFEPLVEALSALPLRESANLEQRLIVVRRALADEMKDIWKTALRTVKFRSPLLVLDEAHHVKNPSTKLASLFMTEESAGDSRLVSEGGPLAGKFERMLFLTATPFQLGHAELIRVLDRFEGIDWRSPMTPSLTRPQFKEEISTLGQVLDDAQSAALRLDGSWSRLPHEAEATGLQEADAVERWWESARNAHDEGPLADVAEQVRRTREAMGKAEVALSP